MARWPRIHLTTGPVDLSPGVLRAANRPVLYHYDPQFIDLYAETCARLQRIFITGHDVVILHGEAVLALEAAVISLISPGDEVLCLVSGLYGRSLANQVRAAGGVVHEVTVPSNNVIHPDDVRRALRRHPNTRVMTVVHVDTPSGTINPLREIGAVLAGTEILTIADVASSLGGEPFSPDAFGVDIAVAGSQKCLGAPPGLAPVAVSARAWQAMARKGGPRGSHLSLLDWKETWLEHRRFPYAPSVTLVYGLHEAVRELLADGLASRIAGFAAIAGACRAAIAAMGLTLWPSSSTVASNVVTAVHVPDGVTEDKLLAHLRQRYGVVLSRSEGELAGHAFRIGHAPAHPTTLIAGLGMLERSLLDLGYRLTPGAGVGAALAALTDWNDAAS
jgi:pyridoxamine--pyruvate transaminase